MSSHFSNLGGLTCQRNVNIETVEDRVLHLLDLISLERFLIVADGDRGFAPILGLQNTFNKASSSVRDPVGLLGIVSLGHVGPLHLEGEEEEGGGVRVLAVLGSLLLVSRHGEVR